MKKSSRKFICQNCGEIFPRWAGKCESCGTWNSIQEEVSGTEKFSEKKRILAKDYSSPKELSEFTEDGTVRSSSGFSELDIVLGGGIVKGGLYLIGGEPGVGKSTLVLSIAAKLAGKSKILYISGEESAAQIKMRAE
ncbi:MAG TPA: DnaB-like helicase C-terminal domain-containing protein, partial [Leptospiraceae bacterium]|nr:DnaB-like helicase C-terminal domain-containing protein [Leptospiraceae bacterium]